MKRALSHPTVEAVNAEELTFDVAASQLDHEQTAARLRKLLRARKSATGEV
ncbi:MAG: hypothetical protein ABSD29_19650 [Verrucomicrobiota bacterium]|jgi:hypothetical protein